MEAQPISEAAATSLDQTDIFKQLNDYDWASDAAFQSGLQAILGSTADPARQEHLTLRARCFYFSRKINTRIDFNSYLAWRAQNPSVPSVNGVPSEPSTYEPNEPSFERRASVAQQYDSAQNTSEPPAPYPTSFEQIVELISTGQPIPGIKDVPNTVLEGQASQANAVRRKKPWEKEDRGVAERRGSEGVVMNA